MGKINSPTKPTDLKNKALFMLGNSFKSKPIAVTADKNNLYSSLCFRKNIGISSRLCTIDKF